MKLQLKRKLAICFSVSAGLIFPAIADDDVTIDPAPTVICEGSPVTLSYTLENPVPPSKVCCKSDGSDGGTWTKDTEDAFWSGDVSDAELQTDGYGPKYVDLEIVVNWICEDGQTDQTFVNVSTSYSIEGRNSFPPSLFTLTEAASTKELPWNYFGYTQPESLESPLSACSDGSRWHAIVADLVATYSSISRILGFQQEPSIAAASSSDYCFMVDSLNSLGIGSYYMAAASRAHEDVHVTHVRPSLDGLVAGIVSDIEVVSVSDTGQGQQQAITDLKDDALYKAILQNAKQSWLTDLSVLCGEDHSSGACAAAEWAVVSPMINAICNHAAQHNWPACSHCP